MEIRRIDGSAFELNSKKAKLIINAQELKPSKVRSLNPNIVLSAENPGSFSVVSPGEYESKELWIMAFPSNMRENLLDVFVINAEEVRIAILQKTVKSLSKDQIEKIGIIDIVIADLSENSKELTTIISEIDPKILILSTSDKESLAQVVKDLGVKSQKEEKKLKVKMEDFSNEDYQLELINLE
ncbi:MAG TPA: hypothetical protein VGA67_05610 [Candidatus Dojkabacteria bacterium]|jgi:hypothetical protein